MSVFSKIKFYILNYALLNNTAHIGARKLNYTATITQ